LLQKPVKPPRTPFDPVFADFVEKDRQVAGAAVRAQGVLLHLQQLEHGECEHPHRPTPLSHRHRLETWKPSRTLVAPVDA
jgi:hypothetical protein